MGSWAKTRAERAEPTVLVDADHGGDFFAVTGDKLVTLAFRHPQHLTETLLGLLNLPTHAHLRPARGSRAYLIYLA